MELIFVSKISISKNPVFNLLHMTLLGVDTMMYVVQNNNPKWL